jgi:hypothetical protein
MYAAKAYQLINKVEEEWLMIMENVPLSEKVTLIIDYSLGQKRRKTSVNEDKRIKYLWNNR